MTTMIKRLVTFLATVILTTSVPLIALAQTGNVGAGPSAVINPIAYDSLGALIVALVRFLLTMIGALSVLFIIIGAVRMVASAGNEKSVKAGKDTVTWAVIGLVVALLAFTIINLVQSVLGRK